MFKRFRDNYINSTNCRIYVLLLVIFLLSSLLTARLFYLQIINGEETLEEFTLKIQKERTINSSRGKIYDRNGVLLAYNELAYNVTIEDVYEPYLMQLGFLSRTARGRCVTKLAYEHLGLPFDGQVTQQSMF